MDRMYSCVEFKALDEDKRILEGIASTPSTDRMDDVVEPLGAEYKLPIPLLWQHDSRQPIGWVESAKVTKDGIVARMRIAASGISPEIDRAWALIKSGLVRGLSIGFKAIETADIKGSYGVRYLKWSWLELSAVTIPANADASITSIKQYDEQALLAASGKQARKGAVSLNLAPGATGSHVMKGSGMTIKEQIAALEAARQAKAARMTEIMQGVAKEGRSTDEKEAQEFDGLRADIDVADADLKRLHDLERLNVAQAKEVNDGVTTKATVAFGGGARLTVNANLEPGIKFARMAMSLARAKYMQKEGRFMAPDEIYRQEQRWMDTAPDVHLAMKAAVNANDSITSAGASQWAYARNIESEFIEFLRPRTLLGRISGWRQVPFNVLVGGMDGGATGYWVGQGLAMNASRPTSTSVSLGIAKVAGLCVITKELAMLSSPSAEAMVRNDLARAVQQKSDTSLIDPNQGGTTNVQPASLTYGVTARQASGTDYAAFKADWKAMTANFYSNNITLDGAVIIMKEELAEALSLMVTSLGNPQFPGLQPTGGTLLGRPVLVSQAADTTGSPDYDNLLILIQPSEVFLADDGQATVEASDQVSIEMDDGPSSKSTPTATGASMVSMFQTESIAIKAVRHVNWAKARSAAVQLIRSAAYV